MDGGRRRLGWAYVPSSAPVAERGSQRIVESLETARSCFAELILLLAGC